MKMIDIRKEELRTDRVWLVALGLPGHSTAELGDQLDELALLADTAGATVKGRTIQLRVSPDPKFYIGSGKALEIKEQCDSAGIDAVVFNDDLSPGQLRNLEKTFERRTIDRSTLILDIFAKHARTYEAKIQVELAQMSYTAPRLAGMWEHFGQQTAGLSAGGNRIGTRGPGETQLEVDKRRVKKRISELREKLKEVELQRATGKKQRGNSFKAALVGYTNVGKSTLLNALAKSQVYTANKLFATLDATTRKVFLPGYGEALISDTVGFIRKLPHHLVASFRSTLEVVTDADLICLVADAGSPNLEEQLEVVNTVLNDLKTEKVKRLLVFNKTDAVHGSPVLERLKAAHPGALFVSALKKEGLDAFRVVLSETALKQAGGKVPDYIRYSTIQDSDEKK